MYFNYVTEVYKMYFNYVTEVYVFTILNIITLSTRMMNYTVVS
jgi:hypothetical protein